MSKYLIINADGYGMTAGINRAIEECAAFGTISSVSVNVNGPYADQLPRLARSHPHLSIGCHLNPVVGRPVLPPCEVPSLLNGDGCFWYRDFNVKLLSGHIKLPELRRELIAQMELCRRLAGRLTHIDAHMAKHRLPRYYPIFLDVARTTGVERIRTHRCRVVHVGPESHTAKFLYYAKRPRAAAAQTWNLWLRSRALHKGLAMPDSGIFFVDHRGALNPPVLDAWLSLISRVPDGINELWVHPAYVDDDLSAMSVYVTERERERQVLLNEAFRKCLVRSDVVLASYYDIPCRQHKKPEGLAEKNHGTAFPSEMAPTVGETEGATNG